MKRSIWLGAAAGVGAAAYAWLWHIPFVRPQQPPRPALSYGEALTRLQQLQAEEGPEINPLCRTQLLTHDPPSRRAVMLYHGYTNCPHQFERLAARLHAAGYTVFIPRLPLHGQVNRRPNDLDRLTVQRAIDFVQTTVDLAAGLADELTVLGFSFGGILAGWAAHHRPEVQRALLVSAAFGLKAVRYRRLYAALLPRLPEQFRWWDPVLQDRHPGPAHAYWGFSRRGVGNLLRMGLVVEWAARRTAPAARSICVLVNPSDEVVDNRTVLSLAKLWKRQGAHVETCAFRAEDQLIHDLMDPLQPAQQVEKVYPLVEQLLPAPGV